MFVVDSNRNWLDMFSECFEMHLRCPLLVVVNRERYCKSPCRYFSKSIRENVNRLSLMASFRRVDRYPGTTACLQAMRFSLNFDRAGDAH